MEIYFNFWKNVFHFVDLESDFSLFSAKKSVFVKYLLDLTKVSEWVCLSMFATLLIMTLGKEQTKPNE